VFPIYYVEYLSLGMPLKGQSHYVVSCFASVMKALVGGRREEAGRLIRNRAFGFVKPIGTKINKIP
jgi:hypothetical protein